MTKTTAIAQDKFTREHVIADYTNSQETLELIATDVMTMPKFSKNHLVQFVGGVGKILNCRPDSGTWIYIVEMEMSPKPSMGRLNDETTILLHETEIQGLRFDTPTP